MGPYVVTSDDSYAQGMAVPWHGSIAPVRLEVPAAGAYRQVHCSLSTSLFTLYCNVLFCTILYCTDVGNYLQIKSSNHNSHIGPNLLISAEKKAFRTQLSSCPDIQARAIQLLDMAQSGQDLDIKTSGIVTWQPRTGLYLAWLLFRSRHYRYSMKICPVELAEVCREETSLGRTLVDPPPRGSPLTGLAPRPLVPPGQGVGSLPSPPRQGVGSRPPLAGVVTADLASLTAQILPDWPYCTYSV